LHRLTVNVVLADRRSQERRLAHLDPQRDPDALPALPRPSGIRLDLEAAVAVLPPKARAVFVLHDVEGWSHEEIASAMEINAGTSKGQLHRARGLLKEALS
jgi:RNA polymerase sigma-70 factor (ECF subfamily)